MRTLNVPMDDEEYEALEKLKGEKTWKEFLIETIKQRKK